MKESTQTLFFLLAAIVAVGVATQVQPTDATYEASDLEGKPLFPPFEAEKAKSLRIVRVNEETATLSEFEVAEKDGVWSLPSKGGYPADAERQMAEATTGVTDLEILTAIKDSSAADHEDYGLVEPSSSLEVGAAGVGTRVTLTSDSNEALVDIIIGKQVKGTTDQRYVRRTTQDAVFIVKIDPEKFSTSFEDWIEDDLLDFNAWDLARVLVRDYTAELVMQGFRPAIVFEPRGDYKLDFDDEENKWSANRLRAFNQDTKDYQVFELAAGETLNETTLNDLKTAVGDLRIVDVERKPTGLSADLQAGDDFFGDAAAMESLMRRGFAPTKGEDDSTDILSSEGEVLVATGEGVEYVLRFGNLQLDGESSAEAESEAEDAEVSGGVNRFLFVMARVNEDLIEKPVLEDLPEGAAAAEPEPASEEAEAEATEEAGEGGEDGAGEGESAEPSEEEQAIAAIRDRNQRAQDEYEAKLEKARARVDELNARFGDWYYVIADDVYKKIAVGRDELIQSAEPAEADSDSEAPAGIPGLPNIPGIDLSAAQPEAAEPEVTEFEATEPEAAEPPAADPPEEGAGADKAGE